MCKQISRVITIAVGVLLSTVVLAVPTEPKVYSYTLDNGLQLYVKPDHRAPIVVSQIWYRVGSAMEPGGLTGISHVLEHMMFKGTRKYPSDRLSRLIAEKGGEQNAFTSRDFTAYFQKLPKEHLSLSLELEADRMQHLQLKQQDFRKEIEVVKEERRMRYDDNPVSLTYERFNANAFVASPYHHMPIGWMSDLKTLTIEDVKQWYKAWYAPNNALLVVVGDVDPSAVYQLAKKAFAPIKPVKLPEVKSRRELTLPGQRKVEVKEPAKLPLLLLGYNVPSVLTTADLSDAYALEVAAYLLGGSDSARLTKHLVRENQIASEINVSYGLFDRFDSVFYVYAVPRETQSIAHLQKALRKELNRLKTTFVTQAELDRVKAQVVANKIYSQDSIMGQAIELGQMVSVGLKWQALFDYPEKIKSVTPEHIQAVAKKYFILEKETVAELVPLPLPRR